MADESKGEERARMQVSGSRTSHRAGPGEAATLASTAGMIGLAALIVEPEMLAGIVLGAGLVYASTFLSGIVSAIVTPVVKTAVKAGYSVAATASEMAAEVTETMHDAVAEARAEHAVHH